MKFKPIVCMAMLGCAGGLLTACNSDYDYAQTTPSNGTSFTSFVKTQLQRPGNSSPVAINGVDFSFPDLNNPNAYDSVLPPSSSPGG